MNKTDCSHSTRDSCVVDKIITPIVHGALRQYGTPIDYTKFHCIFQQEYGVITKTTDKHIIGSFGALSCVILCMRNRITFETILAHIDTLTLDPMEKFLRFPPNNCDVYIVGGNFESFTRVYDLLRTLQEHEYEVTYCHILDKDDNNFAINCMTGEVYLDEQLYYNKNLRQFDISSIELCSYKPLRFVPI